MNSSRRYLLIPILPSPIEYLNMETMYITTTYITLPFAYSHDIRIIEKISTGNLDI